MLKRLIEVSLPLSDLSGQSGREKRQISALHMWWARRPLSTCRAVAFASLVPDPDDPSCPKAYKALVMEVLEGNEFKPRSGDGSLLQDTPRNRCVEFIKHLVQWENSHDMAYIEPARKLIAAAHTIVHPKNPQAVPRILDPFAGGGAIPLEAMRLGCESLAIDLNPVAHLIELCTLEYPQKYGKPDSRSLPHYIHRLINQEKPSKLSPRDQSLFPKNNDENPAPDEIIPHVRITAAEYRKNPLATDVRYWGYWVLRKTEQELSMFFPSASDGIPVAYLWARSVQCPNPTCRATIPLVRQLWLCKKARRTVAAKMLLDKARRVCTFKVVEGREIDFDPNTGTMKGGNASCPFCEQLAPAKYLRDECKRGRMPHQMMAVVTLTSKGKKKEYRNVTQADLTAFHSASKSLADDVEKHGEDIIPTEQIARSAPRRVSPPLYGLARFVDLFNPRQTLVLSTLARNVGEANRRIAGIFEEDYARAVATFVGFLVDKHADHNATLVSWHASNEQMTHVFTRQALPMMWDYCEANPFSGSTGSIEGSLKDILRYPPLQQPIASYKQATIVQGTATSLGLPDKSVTCVLTDPPYYDAVPYADLSDYFYVWLKRTVGAIHPASFRTPLTPKKQEITEQRPHRLLTHRKDRRFYEERMGEAFAEMWRVLDENSIANVMFAHKSTTAWEALISGLLKAGFIVTASWPLHTEMKTRLVARNTAALASSVTLVCRKTARDAEYGIWDDVRQELKTVAQERLDFFWSQGIRGADFFISAIGPALSVFGKYERVTKLSGEEVTVGQFLDEVRSLVTGYALTKILKTTHTGTIDPESRFYVVWKWSYGDAKVPADESFKLAQALGMDTDLLWDKTGVLEKSGENVLATPISKRVKIKNLGDPAADGTPASLIDVLHRMCAFREKSDTQGMAQFLNRSGHANNHSLWLIAQAVSEILSDGDKEKQLMQGLLNQKDGLVEATRQGELF